MKKKQVSIFIPCFMDQLFPNTAMNMVKVLEFLGCEVSYNQEQTCCGQPAYNAGYFDEAREVAHKMIMDLKGESPIVSPSASCTGMIRYAYSTLLENDTNHLERKNVQRNTFEFTEFLTQNLGVTKIGTKAFPHKVTYHDSCSALRECKIFEGPRQLLRNVDGLELVELPDNETCCGFGGTFAVKFEAISVAMAQQKVNHALSTGSEYIVSTDISCLMHLEAYIQKQKLDLKCIHIADLLAATID